MELVTARLRLDALRPDDAPMLFAYRADAAVNRYQGWRPITLVEVTHFIERQLTVEFGTPGSWRQFAIRPRDGTGLIGDLGLHFVDPDTVELGITLAPAQQSRGFAGEAMRAALDLVFGTLGRHRAYAAVDPRNVACVRLLQGLGLRQEALFREGWRDGAGFADEAIYALLAREWRAMATGAD